MPKLRLITRAPVLAAMMTPADASEHVICGGRPTDSSRTPGNAPNTPLPLRIAPAADATIVPWRPSTGPVLTWRVLELRSGSVRSTRSSTIAIAPLGLAPSGIGAGGVSAGSITAARGPEAGSASNALARRSSTSGSA